MERPALRCPNCGGGLEELVCRCGHRLRWRGQVLASAPPDYEPAGFSRQRRDALVDLAAHHFWFGPRERLLARILTQLIPRGAHSAVDLGCGSGQMLPTLAARVEKVVGIDGHASLLELAADRASGALLIHSELTRTPLASEQFDLLIALDVLEHLEPREFLAEAKRLAKPGARLLLSVPASDLLWSDADSIAGHRCRYSSARLRSELRQQGWTPFGQTFYQMLLFPLMLLTRRIAPRRLRRAERRPPAFLSALLGAVNSLEVSLSSHLSLPFGSSLIMWARS